MFYWKGKKCLCLHLFYAADCIAAYIYVYSIKNLEIKIQESGKEGVAKGRGQTAAGRGKNNYFQPGISSRVITCGCLYTSIISSTVLLFLTSSAQGIKNTQRG